MSALSWSGPWAQPSRASLREAAAHTGLRGSLQMPSDSCIVTSTGGRRAFLTDGLVQGSFLEQTLSKVSFYPTSSQLSPGDQ